MREFNTFGPVNPKLHYHVNRVAVKAAMREKIEKGRYFTLNAARQTGKTTLFREVIAELETEGKYFGIILDFGALKGFKETRWYERLATELQTQAERLKIAETPIIIRDHGDFIDWLKIFVERRQQPGILIIDEFDATPDDILANILSLFRAMYMARDDLTYHALHSLILVGVRNIPALLEGTQSPFNIADQFSVPYFTSEEVANLLEQHTLETSQPFSPEVIEGVTRETEGQPFLVNRLGQLLTQEIVPDQSQLITSAHLDYALARLINENNTHFASITSKAIPHRRALLPILFYNETRANFREPVTEELLMYGVLRVVEDEHGGQLARLANPIYRKVLLLTFVPVLESLSANGVILNRYIVNGTLNFDGVLDSFKAFMEEHGVRLLRSESTGRPLEISGQYLLLSYLSAVLNSVGGYVTIESLSSAGEMDILAFYHDQRFIVETKIWYGPASFEAGKEQLVKYLQATNLAKGYLVVFDEKVETNPLITGAGAIFETQAEGKVLRVYLIGVKV